MNEYNKKKYIHIDKDELYYQYVELNKTQRECADYFECSYATIQKKIGMYNIKKGRKLGMENTIRGIKRNHGVDKLHLTSQEKRKKTNIEKYGAETPFQSKKIQDKVFEHKRKNLTDLEKEIADILVSLGLNFEIESKLVINNKNKWFDFKVTLNGIEYYIEADGFFHVNSTTFPDRFLRNLNEEEEKNRYCFENNIHLIRILYFISAESKKQLILDAIPLN